MGPVSASRFLRCGHGSCPVFPAFSRTFHNGFRSRNALETKRRETAPQPYGGAVRPCKAWVELMAGTGGALKANVLYRAKEAATIGN